MTKTDPLKDLDVRIKAARAKNETDPFRLVLPVLEHHKAPPFGPLIKFFGILCVPGLVFLLLSAFF